MDKYFIRFFQYLTCKILFLSFFSINVVNGQWITLNTQYQGGFLEIHFFTSKEGIVSYNSPEGSNYILKTLDGGNFWDTIKVDKLLKLPPGSMLNHFFFLNDTMGYANAGKIEVIDTNDYSTCLLLKTYDSGNSWQSIYSDSSVFFTDVFFINQIIGFATSYDRKIYKTIDNGKSWVLKNSLPESHENLFSVWFTSDTVGYAAGGSFDPFDGKNLILKTTNAGETWQENNYETGRFVGAIHFPTPEVGYAAGAFGKIMKTTKVVKIGKHCIPVPILIFIKYISLM